MICVDANVLLEVILIRDRTAQCEEYLERIMDNVAVTALTVDIVMYYAERHKLSWQTVKAYLDNYTLLPMMPNDIDWAFARFDGKDFEDALQVGCALREGCDRFVTLDQNLAKKYKNVLSVDLIR